MLELEQLKQLVFDGGYDQESKGQVAQYEAKLSELLMKERAIENPVIKEYVDYLQLQIDHSEHSLKTDRKLTDRERDALFSKIDTCNHFLSLFNGRAKEAIRQNIIKDLDNARSQYYS